jgi:predicted AAA+ superfamily ATPase
LNNFSPVLFRRDKGDLLENLVYNLLKKHYSKEQILYWITRDQNEVDFIIDRQFALEVKYNAKNIKVSKYKLFQQTYPEIPLRFACLENIENHLPVMGI